MSDALAHIIFLMLCACPTWDTEKFDAFYDRIEPLIRNEETINQEDLDKLMQEFDLYETDSRTIDSLQCTE